MYGATKSRFSDVRFEELNIDDTGNADIVQKYGVKGVPRVVFLDSSGKVLFNNTPSINSAGWEQQIKQYHQ